MGDLPYISSEQAGGLIICTWLIIRIYHNNIILYKLLIPIQELRAEEGGGLITHYGLIILTIRYCNNITLTSWVSYVISTHLPN